ncbi:hypothetical protein XENOCAPTIV_006177 [Xenoophorus captivus]|uniref:Uncharacterized protein n=1 Tax=Xenoophorus captivus TaxID=1517983 RepID=A0ABV0SEJ7_9TELE
MDRMHKMLLMRNLALTSLQSLFRNVSLKVKPPVIVVELSSCVWQYVRITDFKVVWDSLQVILMLKVLQSRVFGTVLECSRGKESVRHAERMKICSDYLLSNDPAVECVKTH